MAGKQYVKCPIREAIFDVKLKFEEPLDISIFDAVFKEIQEDYPEKKSTYLQSVSFEIKKDEEPKVNSDTGINGIRVQSADGTKVVQMRLDGFTFSQLSPYKDWGDFIDEALSLFSVYKKHTKPSYANRVALRYINAIDIPESNFTLEEYFNTAPQIAKNLPQGLIHFFSRMVIKDDNSDSIVILNQTVEDSKKPDSTTVLFDLDVFQDKVRVVSDEITKDSKVITELKEFRTKIFEESLTEKTKKLFK